jgi:hypothetical protein
MIRDRRHRSSVPVPDHYSRRHGRRVRRGRLFRFAQTEVPFRRIITTTHAAPSLQPVESAGEHRQARREPVEPLSRVATAQSDGVRRLGVPVIMGGIHATMCVDEVLPRVDAVVTRVPVDPGEAGPDRGRQPDWHHTRAHRAGQGPVPQYGVDTLNTLFLTPSPGTRLWDQMACRARGIWNSAA